MNKKRIEGMKKKKKDVTRDEGENERFEKKLIERIKKWKKEEMMEWEKEIKKSTRNEGAKERWRGWSWK